MQIDRVVDPNDSIGESPFQFEHSGGRGCRDDHRHLRQPILQPGDQFRGQVDFPHADCIQPENLPAGHPGDQFRTVESEALTEILPPLAAAHHLDQEEGRGENEQEGEEQLIADPDGRIQGRRSG